MYYNARYYASSLGRFVSADTIVPGAGNPQTFNRYSYSLSNPIRYRDPSGHRACDDGPDSCEPVVPYTRSWRDIASVYGVIFSGNGWDDDVIMWITQGIMAVGRKLASELGDRSAIQAFKDVYGLGAQSMNLQWGNCDQCNGAGAYTYSRYDIRFASTAASHHEDRAMRVRNHIVHELGHAFYNRMSDDFGVNVYTELTSYRSSHPGFPDRLPLLEKDATGPDYGFASPQGVKVWQMSVNSDGSDNEEFADMFLGWVFNEWGRDSNGDLTRAGNARAMYMDSDTTMTLWVDQASP